MAQREVVADSDLIIDFLRGRGPGADAVERWQRERRLRLTVVTAYELRVGADYASRESALERLLRRRSLPLDVQSALIAGEVFARLQRSGEGIGAMDCLQAGICIRHDVALATRNVRHFERIPELHLATPQL